MDAQSFCLDCGSIVRPTVTTFAWSISAFLNDPDGQLSKILSRDVYHHRQCPTGARDFLFVCAMQRSPLQLQVRGRWNENDFWIVSLLQRKRCFFRNESLRIGRSARSTSRISPPLNRLVSVGDGAVDRGHRADQRDAKLAALSINPFIDGPRPAAGELGAY